MVIAFQDSCNKWNLVDKLLYIEISSESTLTYTIFQHVD